MNKIVFRKATLNDVDALYHLGVEFERFNKQNSTRPHEHFCGDWEKDFVEEIQESVKKRNSYVFIAFDDDKPAGYIYARLCKGCFAFIVEEFFVKPEYSKLGVGGKLLDLVVSIGKKSGYDVKVEVYDWNESAKNYYLKRDFFVESLVLKLKSGSNQKGS